MMDSYLVRSDIWISRVPVLWEHVMIHDYSCLSGLDINRDTIIEVACIITDGSLVNQIEVGPFVVISHPTSLLVDLAI